MSAVNNPKWQIALALLLWLAFCVVVVPAILSPSIGNVFTPVVGHPCMLNIAVEAWVDHNRNGLREAVEPPLGGVKVIRTDTSIEAPEKAAARTDASGRVGFTAWSSVNGCLDLMFTDVVAETPFGFQATTSLRQSAGFVRKSSGVPIFDGGTLKFGFAPTSPISWLVQFASDNRLMIVIALIVALLVLVPTALAYLRKQKG